MLSLLRSWKVLFIWLLPAIGWAQEAEVSPVILFSNSTAQIIFAIGASIIAILVTLRKFEVIGGKERRGDSERRDGIETRLQGIATDIKEVKAELITHRQEERANREKIWVSLSDARERVSRLEGR